MRVSFGGDGVDFGFGVSSGGLGILVFNYCVMCLKLCLLQEDSVHIRLQLFDTTLI